MFSQNSIIANNKIKRTKKEICSILFKREKTNESDATGCNELDKKKKTLGDCEKEKEKEKEW